MAVLERVLAEKAFSPHADLLHDPHRRGVVGHGSRPDAVQPEIGECELDHAARGFAGVAQIPPGASDPIGELGPVVALGHAQGHAADQCPAVFAHHHPHVLSAGPLGLVRGLNPGFCGAVWIGMGDVKGRPRDVRVPRQALDGGCVNRGDGAQQEAIRLQEGPLNGSPKFPLRFPLPFWFSLSSVRLGGHRRVFSSTAATFSSIEWETSRRSSIFTTVDNRFAPIATSASCIS